MFVRYNPNPAGKNVGDCPVRAICKATGRYSRDDGYSRESRGKEAIERMMQDTDDPTVKEALRQAVHVMENA